MNEHYDVSVDSLLLFQRLASPPIPLAHFVWEDAVLDTLSNVLPKQFCVVNKSRDFNTCCSGQWGT